MTFRLGICIFASSFVLAGNAPARAADPDAAAIDRMVADSLEKWRVPGVALVIVRGGRVAILKGYGVRKFASPEPITPETIFPMASCTKAFTATLLATLADDGKLDWDDPVRKHLPAFRLGDANADAMVSLRDLLCHRTGVGSHDLLWYRNPESVDAVLSRIEKLPLEYPFRGGFRYSTLMYMAAGRAAAARGGAPWEVLVKDRICTPLGMASASFTTKVIPADADRAHGHRRSAEGMVALTPQYEIAEPNPAGSLNLSARDVSAWLQFQLADGVYNGMRIVSEKNLAETRTPRNIIPMEAAVKRINPDTVQMSYGMGWVVSDYRGKRVEAHGGIIDGFRVLMTLLPEEKLGIAVLSNLHDTRMNQALTNALLDRYCGIATRDWDELFRIVEKETADDERHALAERDRARNPNLRPSIAIESYAGAYSNPAYGTATVTLEAGKLRLAWSSFRCPLELYEGDAYRVREGYLENRLVEFATERDKPALKIRFLGEVFDRK